MRSCLDACLAPFGSPPAATAAAAAAPQEGQLDVWSGRVKTGNSSWELATRRRIGSGEVSDWRTREAVDEWHWPVGQGQQRAARRDALDSSRCNMCFRKPSEAPASCCVSAGGRVSRLQWGFEALGDGHLVKYSSSSPSWRSWTDGGEKTGTISCSPKTIKEHLTRFASVRGGEREEGNKSRPGRRDFSGRGAAVAGSLLGFLPLFFFGKGGRCGGGAKGEARI